MGVKIEELMQKNEKGFWRDTPDRICYVWGSVISLLPFAIIFLIIDVGFVVLFFSVEGAEEILWFFILFFALNLLPVLMVFGTYAQYALEYPNVAYAITDKRVIIRDGIIGIDFKSIDYAEINHIRVDINILEKIRKVGTIEIRTGSGIFRIISVKNPYKVFKFLQKVSFDVKTDINYPNAKRPDNNPGYNPTYKQDYDMDYK